MTNEKAHSSLKQQLIERIAAEAKKRKVQNLELFQAYVQSVTNIHPDEVMLNWADDALWGVHWGLFRFVHDSAPHPPRVRVFNSDLDADGWECDRTLIYFCALDVPFLVDSLRIALNRRHLNIHVFESNPLFVSRDSGGEIQQVDAGSKSAASREDHGFIMVDKLVEPGDREQVTAALEEALHQVSQVVKDFHPMLQRMGEVIAELEQHNAANSSEQLAFLKWLQEGNYTFLGVSEFRLDSPANEDPQISELVDLRLGLMKLMPKLEPAKLSQLNRGFRQFYQSQRDLSFAKSTQRSSVHRDTYPDYVVVKRRDKKGTVIGEVRFLGLYTARLYHLSVQHIPLVRAKVDWLIQHSGLDPHSHSGKAYMAILEGHPRDELIQASLDELLSTTLGIWKIFERRTVKLFARMGPFQKFVSCIVYLPRESLRTEIRERIAQRLTHAFSAESHEYTTQFLAESVLARIHFVFRLGAGEEPEINVAELEEAVLHIVHDWSDRFAEICHSHFAEGDANRLAYRYRNAFPPGYRHQVSPLEAVHDLELFHQLESGDKVAMSVHQPPTAAVDRVRLKMFRRKAGIELSDMVPLLENLGFRVLEEHPFRITPEQEDLIWMQDFMLSYRSRGTSYPEISSIKSQFREAFHAIWQGEAENDGFNRLIVSAGFDWRQVALLRAYARYMKQLGVPYALEFIGDTLVKQADISRLLLRLFETLLHPGQANPDGAPELVQQIDSSLDKVSSLNEDHLLRLYREIILATQRCNFYRTYQRQSFCLAIKLLTRDISIAPNPKPEFEVFVYSTRVEGVHLRGGRVARGGIRWSDRAEDFRTEILGLVKAQQVKNSVIVPTGAKGGFIARKADPASDREAFLEEGRSAYRLFIGSLLDISDNLEGNKIVRPEGLVARDPDDPYLVVAADKGTATFSDLANEISHSHNFWLGDAFASGGSQGYDHKKMGITARGAWVAVQRHFRELGLNTQEDPFSVVAIGDMAGDVFGNGMLLSKTLRLVGAFNHQHIFFDPDPDPSTSWEERKRLFDMPRSSWSDYNRELISSGGGIFERSAKSVEVNEQMRERLGITDKRITPDGFIRHMLMAEVDLIWNGGIGTYVKAASQNNAEVGDRANDNLRVDGRDLRCRVFGEGGNLGMTQEGRIEFSIAGGICNTDFIDNVAGVDCSDHEVNIKILLNDLVTRQDLTTKQRNELLQSMTEDVANHVLHNCYRQTLGLSLVSRKRETYHFDYHRFLEYLETHAGLKRRLESLPDDEGLRERYKGGTCWTRPELAVMVSYAKNDLKQRLYDSGVAKDPALDSYSHIPFAQVIRESWPENISQHRLRDEIVCNELANDIVNRMGFTFCFRLAEAVGATPDQVARTYHLVSQVFSLDHWWQQIEELDYRVEAEIQHQMFHELTRLIRRSCRWFLRNYRDVDTTGVLELMCEPVGKLASQLASSSLDELPPEAMSAYRELREGGVPEELALRLASADLLFLLPGCVFTGNQTGIAAERLLQFELYLSSRLGIDWLMHYLVEMKPESRWQDLAREANFFDLETLLRVLAAKLAAVCDGDSIAEDVDQWLESQEHLLKRFEALLSELRSGISDLSMLTVGLSDLKDLVDSASRGQRLNAPSE